MGAVRLKLKKIKYRIVFMLCVCMMIIPLMLCSKEVLADDGWVDHYSDIYNETKEVETADSGTVDFNAGDQSTVGEYISDFIKKDIADNLNNFLEKLDMGIDSVILGRLSYSKKAEDVSWYRFEFSQNNPYGLIAAIVYSVIIGFSLIFLVIQGGFAIFKNGVKNSPQSRADLKAELSNTLLFFGLIVLMPFIYDLALYLRDVLLVAIRDGIGRVVPEIKSVSLYSSFSKAYDTNSSFILACLMVGVCWIAIKFGYNYVMIAVTMLIHFISFGFICFFPAGKRKVSLQEWVSTAFSYMVVPIIDYILFMLVCLIPVIAKDGSISCIIQLFTAWSIIPARKLMMAMMGGNPSTLEGIGGMLGLKMATDALRSGYNLAKDAKDKITDSNDDRRRAKEEEELAGSPANERTADNENVFNNDDDEIGEDEPNGGSSNNDTVADDGIAGDNDSEMDEEASGSSDNAENMEDSENSEESLSGSNDSERSDDNLNNDESNQLENENDKLEDVNEQLDLDNRNLRDRNNDIDNEIKDNDRRISYNDKEMEKLQAENERLESAVSRARNNGDNEKADSIQDRIDRNNKTLNDKIAENKQLGQRNSQLRGERNSNNANIAANNASIRRNSDRIRNNMDSLRASQRANDEYLRRSGMAAYDPRTATPEMRRAHDIALKRANVNNFDSPQMQGLLSHQEMADFYKKRSAKGYASALGRIVGGGAGGVLGGSLASWEGFAATSIGAGYGSVLGASAGETLGNLGYASAGMARSGFNNVRDYINSGRYAEDAQRHARAMSEMGVMLGLPQDYYDRQDCGYAPIGDRNVENIIREQDLSMPDRNRNGSNPMEQSNYGSGDWHEARAKREEYAREMDEGYRQIYEEISSRNKELKEELDKKYNGRD